MQKQKSSNRRQFLKATGAAATIGTVGLAGCLGGGGGNSGGASGGNKTLRDQYGLQEPNSELESTLNIFQWTDYWPSGFVKIFEDAYGVKVNVTNFASNEEMFNKIKAGGKGQFDLTFPSDYMVDIMTSQDYLEPLDLSKIPNWDNLEPRWINQAPYDPGSKRHSVPYQWGTSGVGWNTDMTPDVTADSWDVMWNEKYKGQMTMLNDMRETIGASLKRLGYSLNTTDKAKIEEAKKELIKQKPLLLSYDSVNMAENLQNKTASPLHAWSGDAFSAYWALYDNGSSPIKYKVPGEGDVVWVDTCAMPKGAKNTNAAYAFINFFLNAKMGAKISNYVYYPSPNKAAKKYIDKAALNNPAIYPPQSVMDKLEFIRNVGDASKYYSQAWTEIKNA